MLYKGESFVSAHRTYNYIVVSSDVLSHNRVNVAEEKSERVIWYKVWASFVPAHITCSMALTGKDLDG
jgi:hypothetical protein